MTPALKAMVEAMAAELERQADKGGSEPHFARLPGLHETHYFSGNLDLEKVARAGLEAIREPGEEAARRVVADATAALGHYGGDWELEGAYRAMIDAILTPTRGNAEAKAVAPVTLVQITRGGELDLLEVADIGEAPRTLKEEIQDPMGSRVPTTFTGKDLHGDLPSRIGRNRSFQLRLGDGDASFTADMKDVAFRAGQARITMMVKSAVVCRWTDPPTTGEKP